MMFHSNIRGMVGNSVVWFLTFNKLLVIPALLLVIFYFMGTAVGLSPDKLVVSVLILQSSMPCMANIIILAKVFGADDHLATANVFISTILSIITLPVVLYLMTLII